MRGLALTIAIGTALTLAACGGSDKNNASNNTTTTQTTATQPGTGTTGKAGKKSAKSGKGKGGGGSKTQTTQTQTQTATTPPSTPQSAFKTAKNVCGSILPIVVQRQLRQGKTTKKKVAKQYSTGWPAGKRKQAYRGCLAGLSKYK